MRHLPEESLTRTTPEVRDRLAAFRVWSNNTELLAQIKEEISILAADHRRKKPVEVPRPGYVRAAARRAPGTGQRGGFAHAVGVLKRHAAGSVRVMA